ncbi:MAG: LytTR family DNA-binding domain-containing protein [Bacteroidota bacterium]
MFENISASKKSIALVLVMLILAITFQTFQQLFYIRRFQLITDITFMDVLKNQSFRWIIWMLLGIPLYLYFKRTVHSDDRKLRTYLKEIALIVGLIILNISIISAIQLIANGDPITLENFFSEYFLFFLFQKAPIYTLGYIAISVILYLYFTNEQLQIQILGLADVRKINEELYQQLRAYNDDKTKVLNIKIGNKRKIIPVEDILWIEADDYCVKVHLTSGQNYIMRSSLKSLEQKLTAPFIRVHRKAIVNMSMAEELTTSHTPRLILKDKIEIPVSKSHLKVVRSFIS